MWAQKLCKAAVVQGELPLRTLEGEGGCRLEHGMETLAFLPVLVTWSRRAAGLPDATTGSLSSSKEASSPCH